MNIQDLATLERMASKAGLILRIQERRPLGLWTIRVVIAQQIDPEKIQIWAEMKAWAYSRVNGLQLDTMRVHSNAPRAVGDFLWSATMAWALEKTPCKKARLLAIRDQDSKHLSLVRYFRRRGFRTVREVGAAAVDLPLRMVWGGAGNLMNAYCIEVLERSCLRLNSSLLIEGSD